MVVVEQLQRPNSSTNGGAQAQMLVVVVVRLAGVTTMTTAPRAASLVATALVAQVVLQVELASTRSSEVVLSLPQQQQHLLQTGGSRVGQRLLW